MILTRSQFSSHSCVFGEVHLPLSGRAPSLVKARRPAPRALTCRPRDRLGAAGRGSGNSRNGSAPKPSPIDVGPIDLEVQETRPGSFDPKIVRKGQTRHDGFNDGIIARYARGLTTRDIQAHLRECIVPSPELRLRRRRGAGSQRDRGGVERAGRWGRPRARGRRPWPLRAWQTWSPASCCARHCWSRRGCASDHDLRHGP